MEKGEAGCRKPSANSNVPHRAFDFGRRRRCLCVCAAREATACVCVAWIWREYFGVYGLACWTGVCARGAGCGASTRGWTQRRSVGSGECGVWARGMRGIRRFGCTNQHCLRLTYSVPSISPRSTVRGCQRGAGCAVSSSRLMYIDVRRGRGVICFRWVAGVECCLRQGEIDVTSARPRPSET